MDQCCHPFLLILGVLFSWMTSTTGESVGPNIDDHPPRDFNTNFRVSKFAGPPLSAHVVKDDKTANPRPAGMASLRVVNGNDSGRDENKFYTTILDEKDGQYMFSGCGASHITNCHVLTAAHCVYEDRLALTDGVMVGAWKPYQQNGGEDFHFSRISSPSTQVTVHPHYNPHTSQFDIAIIRIDTCTTNLENFQPIELAKPGYDSFLKEGDVLRACGFGRTFEEDESVVTTLQTAQVPYIPREQCGNSFQKHVSHDMMCAGYEHGGIDTCDGDSGGPLVHETNGNLLQVGVTSWGVGCARRNSPGVYSSVSESYDWITSVICNDDEVTSMNCRDSPSNMDTVTAKSTSAPTSVPTSAPTLAPTSAPTHCVARYDYCNHDDDCCAGHCDQNSQCHPYPQRQKLSHGIWDDVMFGHKLRRRH